MKFKDLLSLKRGNDLTLSVDDLEKHLTSTPLDVMEQLYSDHGLSSEFQDQYADVDINNLRWSLINVEAKSLIQSSIYEDFENWFLTCIEKSKRVGLTGDYNLVHNLKCVSKYWKDHKTWDRPPVFFSQEVLSKKNSLHLVEGHSRLGALKGLVEGNSLSGNDTHMAWIGSYTHA